MDGGRRPNFLFNNNNIWWCRATGEGVKLPPEGSSQDVLVFRNSINTTFHFRATICSPPPSACHGGATDIASEAVGSLDHGQDAAMVLPLGPLTFVLFHKGKLPLLPWKMVGHIVRHVNNPGPRG